MSSSLIGDDEVVIGVVGGGCRVEGHLVCFAFQSPMDAWVMEFWCMLDVWICVGCVLLLLYRF